MHGCDVSLPLLVLSNRQLAPYQLGIFDLHHFHKTVGISQLQRDRHGKHAYLNCSLQAIDRITILAVMAISKRFIETLLCCGIAEDIELAIGRHVHYLPL